jgi:hypothetical protein
MKDYQAQIEKVRKDAAECALIAYPFTAASSGTSAVIPYRRHSYDSGGGTVVWSAWESSLSVPTGTTIY